MGDKYTDVIRKEAVQYINKDYESTNLNKVLNDFKTKLEKVEEENNKLNNSIKDNESKLNEQKNKLKEIRSRNNAK